MAQRALALFLFLGSFVLGSSAMAQQPWTQWVDQNNCAMTRSTWMAVAQNSPGFGWAQSPSAQNNSDFASAVAWLDVLRLTDDISFKNQCCQVDIWENSTTGETVIMKDGQLPGFGFVLSPLNQPVQCCEDAVFTTGKDPLGCTFVPLMSAPGSAVFVTPTGPVTTGPAVTLPSNPPLVVQSTTQPAQPTQQAQAAGTYLGCFYDPNGPYDLDGYLERSAQNTPQRCVQICASQGFAFAGVQYGESCLCGNSYGNYGAAENCDFTCTGDASQYCGGRNANSVYATGN